MAAKFCFTIHNLHDTRNLLAHCWFEPEHDGIEFEYFHPSGKDHPKFEARDKTYWETLFHIRNSILMTSKWIS